MRKWLLLSLVLSLLLTAGCASPDVTDQTKGETKSTEPILSQSDEKMFTDRDQRTDYTGEESVRIELSGSSATAASGSVSIEGSTVTITGDETYLISGTLDNGSIIIDAGEDAKPHLVLEGVSVHRGDSAALEIREADKVVVTLAQGTENTFTSDSFSVDGVDGTLFSRQDLTLNGSGTLTVTAPTGHGIVCKDDLVFTGGNYQISTASHGLDVNDSVRITGETELTLLAGKDGIHCENTDDSTKGFVYVEKGSLNIRAEGDGISAGAYARILDGSFDILAGGGSANGIKEHSDFFGGFMGSGRPGSGQIVQETSTEDSTSMKGLKAAGDITVTGGTFVIDAADDALHSDTSITVTDGSFQIKSGDDAFHADETLTVAAGVVNVETSYEGLEAHKVYVQGGELEIHANDDGINAAGGQDESGTVGGRDGMFGGDRPGGGGHPGGGRPGGPMGSGSSNGVIEISGGQLKIYSSGDGMDANGSIAISDGSIYVANPSSGDTSVLDCDTGAVITGGIFTSTGASTMMAQSFAGSSTQGVIGCTVGNQPAGTPVSVQDAAGNTLVSYETEYQCVLVIISTPDLQKGETYTLTVGETSGSVQAT